MTCALGLGHDDVLFLICTCKSPPVSVRQFLTIIYYCLKFELSDPFQCVMRRNETSDNFCLPAPLLDVFDNISPYTVPVIQN